MKKGLVLLGVFLGAVLLQPVFAVFAEEEAVDTKLDLVRREDREKVFRETGVNIGLPLPIKIAVPGSDMNPIVERKVDQATLKKEIEAMEAKRHFSGQKKEKSAPAEKLHGIVMKRGPLSGMERKEMVPPVMNQQGSYSSFYRERQGK